MRGGVGRHLCLLALLLVGSRAEEDVSSEDLKAGSSHSPEEDSKSAALAQSSAYSDSDSSQIDDLDDPHDGSSLSKSAASAGAYTSNEGQASALANVQSALGDSHLLRPGLYSPGSGSSAQASANNGFGGNGFGLGLYGSGNSYPLAIGPGSNSAQAKAEVQSSANGAGISGLYPGLNYLKSPGLSSAQAQAEVNSQGYIPGSDFYQPGYQPYQPLYQGGQLNGITQVQAQADAISQLSGGGFSNQGYPGYQNASPLSPGGSSAQALAEVQASSDGTGQSNAGAYSRIIPRHEYIIPNSIPGAKDSVLCQVEGQLFYIRSEDYQCLVCTCIRELGQLTPICASCEGCTSPPPPIIPQPVPQPPEPQPIVTVAPVPQPLPVPPAPQVTCSPLPSGQPFQNPLNPCQICVCRETMTALGEPDVQIDCQQNPECVIPADVTTLPPDIPVPVPLPVCDKFPPNVIFPHPTDVCKVCKCIAEPIGLGMLEPRIVCMTLPECIPRPFPPIPTPAPEPITLLPFPPIPTPAPIPIPPEPIPWPPVTTPAPIPGPQPSPGPGPLPGPSPHESCRPYPPNTPFQHPWDECQVCVCTEAYSLGHITIEVNCFTKKSCCYEPPESITSVPPIINPPSIQVLDKICEYKSLGVEFSYPGDICLVCTCELQGSFVTSVCKRSQTPECLGIYYQGGSGSSVESQASASAQTGLLPSPYNPLPMTGASGGPSLSTAEANALAQSSLQQGIAPGLQQWLQPGYQQLQPILQQGQEFQPSLTPILQPNLQGQGQYYIPGWDIGQPGGSQGSALAEAQAQGQGQAQAQAQSQTNTGIPVYNPLYQNPGLQGSNLSPYWINNANALANAEVLANALQSYSQPSYPGNYGVNSQYQIPYYITNQGGGYNLPIAGNRYGLGGAGLQGSGSSLAEAQAITNTLSGGNYGPPYYGGDLGQGNSASAEAKVQTSLLGGGGGGSLYPVGSSYSPYQYFKQGYQPVSVSSQAQAQAKSSGGSSAQSQALATAGTGKKLGKSAQEDIDLLESDSVE